MPGVACEIARAAEGRELEGFEEARVRRLAGSSPADEPGVAVEVGAVVADIVEVAIRAAERDVEGRAGGDSEHGGEAQPPESARRVERAGEDEAVSAVERLRARSPWKSPARRALEV